MRRHLVACDLYEAAGHTNVPIPIKEVRAMATKVKGKVKEGAGRQKFETKPTPPHFAAARAKKAARVVKRLKANREAKR